MPRFDYIYTNFSAGEFSPLLAGRIDLEKYKSGCEILENYIPRPHGPAVRRGGTRFIHATKDSTKKSRLIPFDTGAGSGLFHLEFGDLYIRFYTEDGILEEVSPTPYEIVTAYTEAELFDITYLQDANTLYLFHQDHPIASLIRNDTYDWSLTDVVFTAPPAEWTAGNYPTCGTFFEQRLIVGGCPGDPSTLWGSKIGEYFNFTIGTNDDDAFTYTIYTDRINLIKWLSAGEILAIGTTGGEYKMTSTSFNETITPANVKIVRQTNYGTSNLTPIRIGNKVIFVQKGKLKVRNFGYKLDSDSYTSEDLTILSEHITKPSLIEAEYSNEPDSLAWYIRDDGELIGFAYEPEINIAAWFRLVTNGFVESISVTDGWSDTRFDDVMLIVNRYIDGQEVRYVEKLERPLAEDEDLEDAFYVDCGATYNGAPANVFSDLGYLEGEWVSVLGDGGVLPDVQVIEGQVTLPTTVSKLQVGLPYLSTLKTMRPEGGNPIGTSQGKTKRVSKVTVRINRTVGLLVNGERYFMGPPTMNQPVPLESGDVDVAIDDGYETNGQIVIQQNQPLPSTIVCIMPSVRTE